MFKRFAAAGAVIACASTFQAHAEPLLFKFTAEVAETNGWLSGVAVGDTFSGSFIYDSSTPGHELNPGAVEYVFARPNRVSFVVGGHTVNVGGLVAAAYSFGPGMGGLTLGASSALHIDGALFSDGYFAYQFANSSAGIWPSTDLPTTSIRSVRRAKTTPRCSPTAPTGRPWASS